MTNDFEFDLLSDDELLMEEANADSSSETSSENNVHTNTEKNKSVDFVDHVTGITLGVDDDSETNNDNSNNFAKSDTSVDKKVTEQASLPWELQAKALVEQGIWNDFGDVKIDSKEAFLEEWNKQKENVGKSEFDKFKSSLRPEQQKYLDLVKDLADHDLAKNLAERITTLESVEEADFDNEEFAKSVYFESLLAQGIKKEAANELVNDAYDLGKIKEKALAAKDSLLEHDKNYIEKVKKDLNDSIKEAETKQTKKIENIYNKILSTDEVLPGLKITQKFKDDTKSLMSTAVDKDANGRPITIIGKMRKDNPEEFERALYSLTQLGLLKIDPEKGWTPDISMLKQIGIKSSIEKLDEVVNSGNQHHSDTVGIQNEKITENTESALSALKSAFGKR